jgi:hypothetical protein
MPVKTSSPEKVRLNFEVTPELKDSLVGLQDRTKSISITEVFRKALALLDMVTFHNEQGGSLILHHKDGREETIRIL